MASQSTSIFLASDRIWPSAINAAFPGARFIARARIATDGFEVASAFAGSLQGDLWGVLIEASDLPSDAIPVAAVTDSGETMSAFVLPGPLLSGDPHSLYMGARYWELPPEYIRQLRDAITSLGLDSADEEPRDDGALGQASTSTG